MTDLANPSSPESSSDFPKTGRLFGIDYGTKRVGVAIAAPDRTIASPIENYARRTEQLDARFYKQLAEDYRPAGLVVGLPLHTNGDESQKSIEARKYGAWLGEILKLPVTFWDERYTSAAAESFLYGVDLTRDQIKKRVDKIAAQIILQSYLDAHRPKVFVEDVEEDQPAPQPQQYFSSYDEMDEHANGQDEAE